MDKWEPSYNRRECKLVQPLWRTVWEFLKKKKRFTTRSRNLTPRHIYREDKNYLKPSTLAVTAALFTIVKTWK